MKTAVFICGPTAVGKTKIAIELAHWLETEIVSFDSRQFYRELKIGAAPPDADELQAVKHHFIGNLSVEDNLSAGAFEKRALQSMNGIFQQHDALILVGGSGLYMKALLEGFDQLPEVPAETRARINQQYQDSGLPYLQEEVAKRDPEYYAQEARSLYPLREKNALQTVGYRELFAHFEGKYDLETAVEEIKKSWLNSTAFQIPIIAIGNLSTGGTGKTPMTEYLLQRLGGEIGVVSRGYGRKSKGLLEVDPLGSARDFGDEPLQMAKKFPRVKFVVSEKRVPGVQHLLNQEKLTCIILDDAYQHRYVKAGFYLLLSTWQ
ncbi:miaA, partial [Symbiodinium sp. CCMP2456]